MGIKSTYTIDRSLAIQILSAKIYDATNRQLAEMLEALPQSEYRNYSVVDKIEEPEEDAPDYKKEHHEAFTIRSASQFEK